MHSPFSDFWSAAVPQHSGRGPRVLLLPSRLSTRPPRAAGLSPACPSPRRWSRGSSRGDRGAEPGPFGFKRRIGGRCRLRGRGLRRIHLESRGARDHQRSPLPGDAAHDRRPPGWEAPLFFANCGQFRDKVRRLARERPLPGSFCSARWSLTSMSLPPKCSRLWMRSSMIAAYIWHSSSHAIASRPWCAAMASTPRWTESTSIPASTMSSMRSTMRPRTALCRPMKGCRLHEHRP